MTTQAAACVYWPPFSRTPGGYALDVARVLRRLIEGRIEQQQQLRPARDERRADGVHRALGEALGHRAGEHGPRLRDRIDPALVVLRRAERRPVVVIAAAIPFAVPGQLEL